MNGSAQAGSDRVKLHLLDRVSLTAVEVIRPKQAQGQGLERKRETKKRKQRTKNKEQTKRERKGGGVSDTLLLTRLLLD